MELLRDLDAFYLEHRECGDLEGSVTDRERISVWVTCSCGARIGSSQSKEARAHWAMGSQDGTTHEARASAPDS